MEEKPLTFEYVKKLLDRGEYEKVEEFLKNNKDFIYHLGHDYWLGDIVAASKTFGLYISSEDLDGPNLVDNIERKKGSGLVITCIEPTYTDDGSFVYKLSDRIGAGWSTRAHEPDITLVERGNIWRFFNGNEPKSLNWEKEARFRLLIDNVEEVEIPRTNGYNLSIKDVVDGLEEGLFHGVGLAQYGPFKVLEAIRFYDRELDKEVR